MEGADTFAHALLGNQVELSDHTADLIEGWVQRCEQAAERMGEAASRMESAAAEHNRAVTRERTGG